MKSGAAQQRTQRTTLRCALLSHLEDTFVHHTASKIFVCQTHHPAVRYRAAENFYELAVAHCAEEAFQVEVNHVHVAGSIIFCAPRSASWHPLFGRKP